jgi:hypothetical protein
MFTVNVMLLEWHMVVIVMLHTVVIVMLLLLYVVHPSARSRSSCLRLARHDLLPAPEASQAKLATELHMQH